MKHLKFALLLFIFIAVPSVTFAESTKESFLTIGGEAAFMWEKSSDNLNIASSNMQLAGISLNGYTFWNKSSIGLFCADSFLFPLKGSVSVNGFSTEIDYDVYNFIMQIKLNIGPAFRIKLDKGMNIFLGVGPSISTMNGFATGVNIFALNLGVAGIVDFKLDLTDKIYFDIGTKIGYDFFCYTLTNSAFGAMSGISSNYSLFTVNPFISLGFAF